LDVNERASRPTESAGLRDYVEVVRKRKWIIAAVALPLVMLAAAYSLTRSPVYTARGLLLIEQEPNILTFEQIFQLETYQDEYYETQHRLLQSRSLAVGVIEELALHDDRVFAAPARVEPGETWAGDPGFRTRLIDVFLGRLSVEPIRLTRLAEVSFKAHDPAVASRIVNTVFDKYIELSVQAQSEATSRASEFLDGQIAELSREIESDEQKLQEYGAAKNIILQSDEETTVVAKFRELNTALTSAQVDRIRKETYYRQIRDIDPDEIPDALNNELIQRLREDYSRLSREYQKMSEKFMPGYPELQRLRRELESARTSLESELRNIVQGAYADYQASLRQERNLDALFEKQRQAAISMNSDAILYNSLGIQVQNNKNVLEALLKRQSETRVSARMSGIRTANIRIVDRAEPPLFPSSPKKKANVALALLLGLSLGTMLAFVVDFYDDSIRDVDDVQKHTGLPTLGIVPSLRDDDGPPPGAGSREGRSRRKKRRSKSTDGGTSFPGPGLAAWASASPETGAGGPAATDVLPVPDATAIELLSQQVPSGLFAESFRTIRTSLLLSSPDDQVRTIAITSALPGEGKTVAVVNLAISLAASGLRTLLVDADLRKPRLHRVFRDLNREGLTNALAADRDIRSLIRRTAVPNLSLLKAGPVPPNPAELLGCRRMAAVIEALREEFDAVLFDTPPLLSLADAAVLGARLDAVVLVIRAQRTSRQAVAGVMGSLGRIKARPLGVILNDMPLRRQDYYYRYRQALPEENGDMENGA
jgi:polysaccharide biosynthesis transport protein